MDPDPRQTSDEQLDRLELLFDIGFWVGVLAFVMISVAVSF
jgi:hypothetical protein